MPVKFTDRFIKSLKPKKSQYDVNGGNGFMLRVSTSGTKMFRFRYMVKGERKFIPIGEYPATTLEEAGDKFTELRKAYKRGEDPAVALREKKAATFDDLSKEYMKKRSRVEKSERLADEEQRILDARILPVFGHRPAGEIKRREVLLYLEGLRDDDGLTRSVNILHGLIRMIFAFGLEREYPGVEFNPARDIRRIGKENKKRRNLSPDEIATFWYYFDTTKINESTVRCLKFILVTGQRPGQCLFIERKEIDGDWWIIPSGKLKTEYKRTDDFREHRVYLTETAKALLGDSDPPFPVPGSVSDLDQAVNRLFHEKRKNRLNIPKFTPHDLRRTSSTQMASRGVMQQDINKVLGHVLPGVEGIYNQYEYDKEKKAALEKLEQLIFDAIFVGPIYPSQPQEQAQ